MASAMFSHIANLGYQLTSAMFGNRSKEDDRPLPPKVLTMNLPAKRSISQTDCEENDMFKLPPLKTRRLSWNNNIAQRLKQQSHDRKKAHSASHRIAASFKFRYLHNFIQMAVTWKYEMLEIPDELKCLTSRLEPAMTESTTKCQSRVKQMTFSTQYTPAKEEAGITMTPTRNEPLTPMQLDPIDTPPSLSYSTSSSSRESSRSPETPVSIYKSRGPSLEGSKFATPGYEPPVRAKSWGLADYPKQKQEPGGRNTVRIYLGDQMQPVAEWKPEPAFAEIADTNMEVEGSYCRPQGFTPTKSFDMDAEARRREVAKVSFNAEARERMERDIDGRYYARWCLEIINAGELPYDDLRKDSEVLKSRWATKK